jgi:hypothetical protein
MHQTKLKIAYRILVPRPEGKKSPGNARCRWDYNINMDLTAAR